jgi:arsenical pump membrane protein
MTEGFALALALVLLAATLGVAVVRPLYLSEAVAATVGAALLVAVGAVSLSQASDALRELGPTVGFLAAMLLIAEGCRRDGLFDALGALMARGARGSPQRLLAFVFAIAAAVTAVLRAPDLVCEGAGLVM